MFLFSRILRLKNKNHIRKKKWGVIIIIFCMVGVVMSSYFISHTIIRSTTPLIYTQSTVPTEKIGLIFGAAVYKNGTVTSILQDRLDTGYELFSAGKIQKIIVSGDNSTLTHNEVTPMRNYLIKKGIPAEDVYPDYAGFDTYDSLYRAHLLFGASSLTLITQKYHMYRALFLCQKLRMTCVGVAADKQNYAGMGWFVIREHFAHIKAMLNIIFESRPKYLGTPVDLYAPSVLSTETK